MYFVIGEFFFIVLVKILNVNIFRLL